MFRFTRYTQHGQAWLLHADVSVEFKEWAKGSEYNKALAEMFFKNPQQFIDYIAAGADVHDGTFGS